MSKGLAVVGLCIGCMGFITFWAGYTNAAPELLAGGLTVTLAGLFTAMIAVK